MGVTHLEIRGIQAFIFQTGRLRDTVGRSALVERLTDPDAEPLGGLLEEYGVAQRERGAGAFTVEGDPDGCRAFTAAYSRAVADLSSSLRLVAVSDPVLPVGTALARARLSEPQAAALEPPLGVVRCVLTGGTATTRWSLPDRKLPVTAEVLAARAEGRRWFEDFRTDLRLPRGLDLSTDADAVAPSRFESTKIAVVLADINQLGDMLAAWHARGGVGELQDAHGMLRRGVRELAVHLGRTVAGWAKPLANQDWVVSGSPAELQFSLGVPEPDAGTEGGDRAIPFQPYVVGGDDLAFVCESRLAWSLVDEMFAYLDSPPPGSGFAALAELGDPFADDSGHLRLTVGVGIAVVPLGYSLSRGHEEAELLMRRAKATREMLREDWGAPNHHAVAWSLIAHSVGSAPITAGSSVYLRHAPGPTDIDQWLARNDPESTASWSQLLRLLDPDQPGSLRSTETGSGVTQVNPWGLQRSRLKSDIARGVLSLPGGAAERAEARTKLGEVLRTYGPALPGIDHAVFPETHARLLGDAITLLDEHLTSPRVHNAEVLEEIR